MISYEEFKDMVNERIKDYLPEGSADARVHLDRKKVLNGIWQDCLTIEQAGKIAAVFDLVPAYESLEDGKEAEDVMRAIAEGYQECAVPVSEHQEMLMDYDKARGEVYVMACNARLNAEILEEIPHERHADLALVYQINRNVAVDNTATMFVTNHMVETWGIDTETLKRDAWDNMRQSLPPVFGDIQKVTSGSGNLETDRTKWVADDSGIMYVLTSSENHNGAVYIFDSRLMGEIAELMGSDLLVLPSSVHDVILVRASDYASVEELKGILEDVNRAMQRPDRVLSGEIYRFDRESLALSVAAEIVQENGMSGQEETDGMQMM